MPAWKATGTRREAGGLSGRPVFALSTEVLRKLSALLGGKVPLIGVGGILTGADARAKVDAGASLVQIYSGFIFRGRTSSPRRGARSRPERGAAASMRIGIPRESKQCERRVGLDPAAAARLAQDGHEVRVAEGAGLGIGASDEAYRAAGAAIVAPASAWESELVVKVKEIQPGEWALQS